jgi:Leucine-rich repeat (LRR) protein
MPKELFNDLLLEKIADNTMHCDDLDLSNQNLRPSQIKKLVHALNQNTFIKKLSLRNNCISNEGAMYLAQLTQIQDLDVGASGVGVEGLVALLNCKSRSLKHLKIDGNKFPQIPFPILGPNPSLRSLDLSHSSSLSPINILNILSALPKLERLSLTGTKLNSAIIEFLPTLLELRELHCAHCSLDSSLAKRLLTLLVKQLTHLDLSHNSLSRNTIPNMAQSSLKSLVLCANLLADDDIAELAASPQLEELALEQNPLLSSRATGLLLAYPALQRLKMGLILIDQEACTQFLEGQSSSSLVSLSGEIENEDSLALIRAILKRNRDHLAEPTHPNVFFQSKHGIPFQSPRLAVQQQPLIDPYQFGLT